MCISLVYTKMKDVFDQKIVCTTCNVQMKKAALSKDGFELRTLTCPRCEEILYHPGDIKEYDNFKRLKQREFDVKLRLVGNSFCVSIPKEIIDFHKEFEQEFDDLVRLHLEGRGRIVMFMSRKFYNQPKDEE